VGGGGGGGGGGARRRGPLVSHTDVLYFFVLIVTIVLHEVSHGVVANWCGDPTARDAGRLTLNPLKHIDPIGTILLPILLIVTTGYAFGWAKPVPVNVGRLRHPRNQAVLVGLAGPTTNLLLAAIAGIALHITTHSGTSLFAVAGNPLSGYLQLSSWGLGNQILFMLGYVNVIIAVFNLIPIPPLDGSAVLERFLPASAMPSYYRMRSFSMILVFFLVFFAPGVLDTIFNHATDYWENLVF
jgi:Zn-dependent protease